MAPCSAPIFYKVNIQIGWWRLTQYNFVALLLAIIALIITIISYFKLGNLTNEPAYEKIKYEFLDEEEREVNAGGKKPVLLSFKDIVTDPELMVILTVECFIAYQSQLEILVNMVTVSLFNWSILRLGVTLALTIIILTAMLMAAEKNLLGDGLNIYCLYVLAFISVMLSSSLLAITNTLNPQSIYWQTFVICLLLPLSFFPYFASTAYCRSMIFFITPAHSASIVESYRLVAQQLSTALAFFTASYVYGVLSMVSLGYCVIAFLLVMFLLFWYKEKYFSRLFKGRGGRQNVSSTKSLGK